MNTADYIALMSQCIDMATKLVTSPDYKGYRTPDVVISIANRYFKAATNCEQE
jgi:hypothetical protein